MKLSAENSEYTFGIQPENRSRMIFYSEQVFVITGTQAVPNIWYRFWHWFFMGIRWESLDR